MALRARNASRGCLRLRTPRTRATDLGRGPRLRRGVRAGSLRAPEPRAREKTRGRRRKKCRCAKKTHLYIPGSNVTAIDLLRNARHEYFRCPGMLGSCAVLDYPEPYVNLLVFVYHI